MKLLLGICLVLYRRSASIQQLPDLLVLVQVLFLLSREAMRVPESVVEIRRGLLRILGAHSRLEPVRRDGRACSGPRNAVEFRVLILCDVLGEIGSGDGPLGVIEQDRID